MDVVGPSIAVTLNKKLLGTVVDNTFPDGIFGIATSASSPVLVKSLEFIDTPANSAGLFAAATQASPFINSLGMKFVPVPITGGPTDGQRVLFSIWETRILDYQTFARDTGRKWLMVDEERVVLTPAISVTWDDAQAFCSWLTERERKAGMISVDLRYRLPKDHEWSCAAGIGELEDPNESALSKNGKLKEQYPWGQGWPPPPSAGNYAGEEVRSLVMEGSNLYKGFIEGYQDKNVTSRSSVGSFDPNRFGLYDLGGNVWEFCEDQVPSPNNGYVLRGACQDSFDAIDLLSSKRGFAKGTGANIGFRVVLAPEK